jgi:hypothetical protein
MPNEIEHWLAGAHFSPLNAIQEPAIPQKLESAINLMDNITRGLMGEVLVAHARGGELTSPWDPYDVVLSNGTRIEVKTSGLIQAWPQQRVGVAAWSIAPASAWTALASGYVWDPDQLRRSDWYFFAVHTGIDPSNVDEWIFRPVPTHQIDSLAAVQKSIRLPSLDRLFQPPILKHAELAPWAVSVGLIGQVSP